MWKKRYETKKNSKWWAQGDPQFGVWDNVNKCWALEKSTRWQCIRWIKNNSNKHAKK